MSLARALSGAALSVAVLSALSVTHAQESAPARPLRDPTDQGVDGARAALAQPLPALTLRGLVVAKGRPGAALIESGGLLFRVEEGASFTPPAPGGGAVSFEALAVSRTGVRLETSAPRRVVILR